ncbi:MAG: ROK family protein [Chloroflexota bacterium]
MSAHIAIDIGGTRMRAASYSPTSLTPIKINRIPSRVPGTTPQERLLGLIASVWPDDEEIEAIGVASAGPVDHKAGIVITSPNITELNNFPLGDYLSQHLDVPVVLGNDANLAAIGERKYGAGQGHDHLIYLTISTGIGSGVIMSGHLLTGSRGMAAELGHTSVLPDGPLCGCGQRGHLEAISSGTAIARWVQAELDNGVPSTLAKVQPVTAQTVAEAARQGDKLAIATFERAGTYLGRALADFLHIFNPSIVIFGGGVSKSVDLFIEHLREAMEKHVISPGYIENLTITTAALGDDSGLMGALALARETKA